MLAKSHPQTDFRLVFHRALNRMNPVVGSLAVVLALCGILVCNAKPADDVGRQAFDEATTLAPPARSPRLPPPTAAEQQATSGLVKEIFGAEAAKAASPAAKSDLAAKLIEQAAEGANPTESYVLLSAAWKLAAEAGDVASTTAAIKSLAERFAIDGRGLLLDAMEVAATKAPVRDLPKTVDALLAISREEADGERLEAATIAAQLATTAARRANDPARRQACAEQIQSLKALAKQLAEIKPLLERLKANPADTDAATELGMIRCFVQGRWDDGLPLLARGGAADLAAMARLEADDSATSTRLGDAWWSFGDDEKAPHSAAARSRAAFHYATALPDLKGLEKARVEKRLQDFAAEDTGKGKSRRPRPPAPGLVLWLDASDTKSIRTFSGTVLDKARGPARVAAWADLSGAGHAAYQNMPDRQPTWTPDGFGKLPAVEFNGKTGLVIDMPCTKAGTTVVVAQPAKVDSMRVLGCHPAGVEHGTCLVVCFRPNGNLLLQATTANPNAVQLTSTPTYKAGERAIVSAAWGRRLSLGINGKDVADPRPLDNFSVLSGPWGIGLTMPSAIVEPFHGAVAEVMIFDRELESPMIDAIARQLTLKWGVTR